MDALFIHLVKSSGILLLFFVIYHAFLKKETFFIGTRWFLASGLLISLIMPFVTISKTIYVEHATELTANFETVASMQTPILTNKSFDWMTALFIIYLIGVVYFSIRLLVQLRSIESIKKKSQIIKEDNFYHVKTNSKISPFSFFRYIFYYPFQFTPNELQTILIHEKEHAKGLHSIDILLTEIVCILQWFNPVIWLYKIMVKQNLEFLADSNTCELYQDKKQYQYLMLKQLVEHQKITIANPFFNSLIKKRIIMLNQNQSKRINRIKLLAVLPLLVLFLFSFNTKEIIVTKESKKVSTVNESITNPLKNPIKVEEQQGLATQKEEGTIAAKKESNRKESKQSLAYSENQALRIIELIITKSTTDDELSKMKKDLAEKDIDFSYTVVHNSEKEIIDINLSLRGTSSDGEKFSGNYNSNSEEPIKDIFIIYDDKANMVSFSKAEHKSMHVFSGLDEIGNHDDIIIKSGNGSKSVWVSKDTDNMETIEIITEDGVKKVVIDGEEVDVDEIHQNHFSFSTDDEDHDVRVKVISKDGKKKLKKHMVKKYKKGGENVFILKDSNEDGEHEDTMIFLGSDESDNGSKKVEIKTMGKDPLYIIDGKEVSKKEFKKLSPDDIATINVYKGKKASEKYGKKAKDGVVEVITKDNE